MAVSSEEPAFMMQSARAAIAGGMVHIEEQVKALELAVVENPSLVFDLARTLIESTCRTIIKERGKTYDKNDDLPKLFKEVTLTLPLLPPSLYSNTKARNNLKKTINGLNTALLGVCELRSTFGFASHGSDAPRPAMEAVQALLAAQAADAIIGFLFRAHREDLSRPRSIPLAYNDNPDFNEWIDEQSEPVQILALPPYRPSEVLFNVDIEAYRALLAEYTDEVEAEQVKEEGVAAL